MFGATSKESITDASLGAERDVTLTKSRKTGMQQFGIFWKRSQDTILKKSDERPKDTVDTKIVERKSKSVSSRMPFDFFQNIKRHMQFKTLKICKSKQRVKEIEPPTLSNDIHHCPCLLQDENVAASTLEDCPTKSENINNADNISLPNENEEADAANVDTSGIVANESESVLDDHEELPINASISVNNLQTYSTENNPTIDIICQRSESLNIQIARPLIKDRYSHRNDFYQESLRLLPEISDAVTSDSRVKASLTEELLKLSKYGWYWGPISGEEADAKLRSEPDGAFLVRDSSDDRYVLTLSFKSSGKLLHARMEHSGGLFSLCNQGESEGFTSVAALINHSMNFSQSQVVCYSRPKYPGHPSFPVRLTKPVSRFTQVRSLQYLCRFVIRQNTTLDNIHKLPLPKSIKDYIEEAHY